MNLEQLFDPRVSDKNSLHSYLPFYESKFKHRRDKVKKVLEIGVERGGSILMWAQYFPNAEIWGLDVFPPDKVPEFLKNNPRIKIYHSTNAYDLRVVKEMIVNKLYFDVIIDDGPHTLESMIFCAKYYSVLLAPGGVLCIEDIPNPDWKDAIAGCVPAHFKPFIECYDIRDNKGRHDDIMFFIDHKISEEIPKTIRYNKMTMF